MARSAAVTGSEGDCPPKINIPKLRKQWIFKVCFALAFHVTYYQKETGPTPNIPKLRKH
jgi:hypothetical protein